MRNLQPLHAISLDYDGCLFDRRIPRPVREQNARLLKAISKQNQQAFAANFVFVGSNRQSQRIDSVNRGGVAEERVDAAPVVDEGSCFLPLRQIVSEQSNTTLCQLLLADAYAERANGYAYTRAVVREADATAYHPDYIFDEYKSSMLYLQAHTVARMARSCDFVCIDSVESPNQLGQVAFESNAAYVYVASFTQLYYVNRAEKVIEALDIFNLSAFMAFRQSVEQCIEDEEHDFEMLDSQHKPLKGITITAEQQAAICAFTNHQHVERDYPIIFDLYDDRFEILMELAESFKTQKQRALLPANVSIRLLLYLAESPNRLPIKGPPMIQGRGPIDLQPKQTVVSIAKVILAKALFEEEDYVQSGDSKPAFEMFFRRQPAAEIFAQRTVIKPAVGPQPQAVFYASLDSCDTLLAVEEADNILARIRVLESVFKQVFRGMVVKTDDELKMLKFVMSHSRPTRDMSDLRSAVDTALYRLQHSGNMTSVQSIELLSGIQRRLQAEAPSLDTLLSPQP